MYASDDKHAVELAHVVGKCSVLPAGSDLPGAVSSTAMHSGPTPLRLRIRRTGDAMSEW